MIRTTVVSAFVVLSLSAAALPARGESDDEKPAMSGHEHHHGHENLSGDAPLPNRSVYQLEGTWTNAAGRPLRLADLRGRPVLALLFYGTCQSACPVLVRDLQRVDDQLSAGERAGLRFLLVTFDPGVDTPERLAAYAKEHGLASDRWTLAHGSDDQVRELAAVLGVKYRATGDGQYSHTQRITLLDRDGTVVEKFDGIDRPIDPIVARTKQELANAAGGGS